MRELQFRGKVESGEARMETQVAVAPVTEPDSITCTYPALGLRERQRMVGILWEDGVDLGVVVKRDDAVTMRGKHATGPSLSLLRGWGHETAILTPHRARHRDVLQDAH